MVVKAGVRQPVRREIFRRDGYRCNECGLEGREERFPCGEYGYPTDLEGVYLSIDHLVPRSKGGTSDPSNLRVLCTTCNTKKGRRDPTPEELRRQQRVRNA